MNAAAIGTATTALVSLIVAVLAHLRATKAQDEQNSLDRDKLINEAYQDVLNELRSEISRLNTSLAEERGRHAEEVRNFEATIAQLKAELREERDWRIRLEERLSRMQDDITTVEKRKDLHDTEEDGTADGGV